jgi:hypothetical protein
MSAHALLRELEAAGAILTIAGRRMRYEVPDVVTHLLPELERQRHEVAKVLRERLAGNVMRWRREHCVACASGSSNPAILHREFFRWSGYRCTLEEFVAALGRLGFELDGDRMMTGLILQEDFAAAIHYERQRAPAATGRARKEHQQ